MDGYKKQVESELKVCMDMDKQYRANKFALLEKLRYMTFVLNTSTCTLLVALNKGNFDKNNVDSILLAELSLLLLGAFLSIISILAGYMSSLYNNEYSFQLCEYEEAKLKNISMFEDYVTGKNYSAMFSIYSATQSYNVNRQLLQRNVAKYEELKEVANCNRTISHGFEKVSVVYIFFSLLFFFQALGLFLVFFVYSQSLFWNLENYMDYMIKLLFIYAVYQMIFKVIHWTGEREKRKQEIFKKYGEPLNISSSKNAYQYIFLLLQ